MNANQTFPMPVGAALWEGDNDPSQREEFIRQWLERQCSQTQGCVAGVLVLGEPDLGPFVAAAVWPQTATPSSALAAVADRCLQERRSVLVQSGTSFTLAEPILLADHLHGLLALELHSLAPSPTLFETLRWNLAGCHALLLSEALSETQVIRERLMGLLNLLGTALNEIDFKSAAHAVATELALQLDCDRVSIGFRRAEQPQGATQVVALSHSAQFGERMNLMQAIAQAMDEALDQHQLINMPASARELCVVRDHAALARQYGSDAILTIPFLVDGCIPGAMVLERTGPQPFERDTVELCQGAVALTARVLYLRYAAQRSALQRARHSIIEQWRALCSQKNYINKLAVGALTGLLLVLVLVPGQHRVSANATIEGATVRQLIAPFDGYLEASHHRAGDVVSANEELARLDSRDLQLEYLRWAAQAEQAQKQYEQHRAEHDRAQSEIAQSQLDQANAQTELLADQIRRAAIIAPFDGVVVSGDLSQMLGSAVRRGQGLFELSPRNQYRVILEVDESDIAGVKALQRGQLVLAALPGQTMGLQITRVTPLVVAKEGRSFYRVEASLDPTDLNAVRPGMEGVGKISLGERSLFWLWTHKMIDWLRLFAWSWL